MKSRSGMKIPRAAFFTVSFDRDDYSLLKADFLDFMVTAQYLVVFTGPAQ